jgi:hypothetical protein
VCSDLDVLEQVDSEVLAVVADQVVSGTRVNRVVVHMGSFQLTQVACLSWHGWSLGLRHDQYGLEACFHDAEKIILAFRSAWSLNFVLPTTNVVH